MEESQAKKSWEGFRLKEVTEKVHEKMTVSGVGDSLYSRERRAKAGVREIG